MKQLYTLKIIFLFISDYIINQLVKYKVLYYLLTFFSFYLLNIVGETLLVTNKLLLSEIISKPIDIVVSPLQLIISLVYNPVQALNVCEPPVINNGSIIKVWLIFPDVPQLIFFIINIIYYVLLPNKLNFPNVFGFL